MYMKGLMVPLKRKKKELRCFAGDLRQQKLSLVGNASHAIITRFKNRLSSNFKNHTYLGTASVRAAK